MSESPPERSLFANGGELGRAMSAKDWAPTPVGDPAGWPMALRNAVRILLTSRFSMWMAWGPELTMFYNDAYERDTLQAKHPWALGRPAGEVWAEIWEDIEPRIRRVLDTGIATWDEDLQLFLERSGYPEETYHTFSYSPLDGDGGGIEGMLCVVTETTERVVGERRMASLRDLAAAVATTRTQADVLAAVTEQLGRDLADLPFSLTYLVDASGTARLGSAAGIEPGSPAAPRLLQLADPAPVWPVSRVRAGEQVLIEDLSAFPDLPTGDWTQRPTQAVAVPIGSATPDGAGIAGFLVVGLNPHRRYDDGYRGFVELVANQIASGLTNASSYEAERHRAEALAELDRAKTDFFSNVSHEFRTPLTLIMGPVAELRSSPVVDGDPRLREEIEVIERNALRLGKLVNTLLDFSRIQAGRIEARFEPVDLATTTAELASVFRSAVERAGLNFVVDCPPLPEPVYIDRDMWERIVLNLLSNALKFTFAGEIAVRLRQVDGVARLTVTDSGTGIPADELPRLFERFHRVADARGRSGEGSGIGLAMVRELVGLHGGTIDVASTPDVGTEFAVDLPFGSVHLPADRLATAPMPVPGRSAAPSPVAAPFVAEALRWVPGPALDARTEIAESTRAAAVGGRVLIADDNADMREYLVRLLEPRYDVAAVGDGAAALEAALADPPDLLVSDVMMPGMDGMELLSALRSDPRTARMPVVLLSARAGQQAAVEGLAAGADDYLVKPFSAEELLARVGAHLQLGRARRAAEERFTAMADLAPALIWVADAAGRRIFTNRGWTSYTGRTVQDELGEGWLDRIHPEDRKPYLDAVGTAMAERGGWEIEFRLGRGDGAFHWLLERAVPIGTGEDFAGYVGSCTDINARFRETERQTLLAVVGAALDRETSPAEQLDRLATLVVESRLADMCTLRRVGNDGRLQFAGIAALDAATEIELARLDPHTPAGEEVLATGRPLLPTTSGPDHAATTLGQYSSMALPLLVRGQVVAVLTLGRRADAPPLNDDDRSLAEEIAARAALALDNAMLLAEERAAAQRLALLQQVTAELSAAITPVDVAVAAAGYIRQLAGDASRVAVYEIDAAHRGLDVLFISGGSDERRRVWAALPLSAPLTSARAVREGRAIWIEDTSSDAGSLHRELPAELTESISSFGLAASVSLPLAVAGRVVGVIGIAYPTVQRFSPTDRAMLLAVAEQCAQALDRARLFRSERRIAETLQRSLLPAELPSLPRLALAAHYVPGAEGAQAGGDWYDVVELEGGRVAIAVGDVVGQGPAAAAVMGQLRSALSAALLQGCGPAEALELLDRFAARLPAALASTAACLIIDPAAGTIRWSRAGHLPPLLLGVEGGHRLLTDAGAGAVLGAAGRAPYSEGSVTVPPGTTVVLYTDGLVERRGEQIDDGLDRMCTVAARHGGLGPDRLIDRLLAEILADTDQPDDVAVIAVRLLPADLSGVLPADPDRLAEVRRRVRTWAAGAGLSEELREDLLLALGEALANAVEHAYAYTTDRDREEICEYVVRCGTDGSVHARVTDGGVWRPPPEDRGHRGRGLELIAALADDVEIGPVPGGGAGTVVSFRLSPPEEPAMDGGPGVAERPASIPPTNSAVWRGDGGPARVTPSEGPAGLRLEVAGELDLGSTAAVRGALVSAFERLPRGGAAELDLTPTTYLASAGVGMILALMSEANERGIDLHLRAATGSVTERVFALSGLGGLLETTAVPIPPSAGG